MFEEGQLYSPVSVGEDGAVTVHLADDHPGASDPAYRARRNEIAHAALAWSPGEPLPRIDYSDAEHAVWRTVCRELAPKHAHYAVSEYHEAVERVGLPRDHVPQLDEVTALVRPLSDWSYLPAAGLVPLREFYGSLRRRRFYSTQYLRHPDAPLYTPEPDVIHEVIGHGHLLATPTFGELHRLAGAATHRLADDDNLAFLSRVFWFSLEFGVVVEEGALRAYGAGILSSYGEIEEFRDASIRPWDLHDMATMEYDIAHYQPVLFAAPSFEFVVNELGDFFRSFGDASIAA